MASYAVRYFDPARSTVVEEQVDAESEAILRDHFRSKGAVLLESRPITAKTSRRSSFEVAWWCRELSTLLRAGMTVVEAVETLHAQSLGTDREPVHAALLRSLGQGQALSKAMRAGGVFPEVLVASVTASERTSTLVTALDDYLRYDEMFGRLRRQAVSAAIYPALVVGLGFLIAMFLLLYVVPRFSRMYGSGSAGLSGTTQLILWFSAMLREWMPVVVAALIGSLLVLAAAWRSGWLFRTLWPWLDAVVPLRRQFDQYRLAKLYQSLALMFRGGYTLDEAMAVCEGLRLGPRLNAGLLLARRDVSRGRTVSASMAAGELADTVAQRLLAVGERTGAFDAVLQTIADRHAQAFATFVERMTRIVEPILLLAVALMVGGIVTMMYMPIFDIANTIR